MGGFPPSLQAPEGGASLPEERGSDRQRVGAWGRALGVLGWERSQRLNQFWAAAWPF